MEYNTKREQFIKELRVNQDTLDNLARVSANARHAQSSSSESGTKGQLERELGKTTQFEKDFSIEQSNTLNNNNNNAAAVRKGKMRREKTSRYSKDRNSKNRNREAKNRDSKSKRMGKQLQ